MSKRKKDIQGTLLFTIPGEFNSARAQQCEPSSNQLLKDLTRSKGRAINRGSQTRKKKGREVKQLEREATNIISASINTRVAVLEGAELPSLYYPTKSCTLCPI